MDVLASPSAEPLVLTDQLFGVNDSHPGSGEPDPHKRVIGYPGHLERNTLADLNQAIAERARRSTLASVVRRAPPGLSGSMAKSAHRPGPFRKAAMNQCSGGSYHISSASSVKLSRNDQVGQGTS